MNPDTNKCLFWYENSARNKEKHTYCQENTVKGRYWCTGHSGKVKQAQLDLLGLPAEKRQEPPNNDTNAANVIIVEDQEELLPRTDYTNYYYVDFMDEYNEAYVTNYIKPYESDIPEDVLDVFFMTYLFDVHAQPVQGPICQIDVPPKNIYPHEVRKFLHDLSAVLYRLYRVDHYEYVTKMSEFEKEVFSAGYIRSFNFVTKSGEIVTKNINQIAFMFETYGVQFTFVSRTFDPKPMGESIFVQKRIRNTFVGMHARPHEKEFLTEERLRKIKPMNNFIFEVICNKDRPTYNWTMSWAHDLFFHPEKKNGKFIVFLGKQGSGKTTLMQFLVAVIGRAHATEFSSTKRFFGRFNGLSEKLLLACFNEMPVMKENSTLSESIKSYVTEMIQNLEKKGYDLIEILNFTKFLFATNSGLKALRLTKSDRRALILQICEKYANNKRYFRKIRRCFTDECYDIFATQVKFFEHLVDVSNDDNMPYSAAREEMIKINAPSHEGFFEAMLGGNINMSEYADRLKIEETKRKKFREEDDEILKESKRGNYFSTDLDLYDIYELYCMDVRKPVTPRDEFFSSFNKQDSKLKYAEPTLKSGYKNKFVKFIRIPAKCLSFKNEEQKEEERQNRLKNVENELDFLIGEYLPPNMKTPLLKQCSKRLMENYMSNNVGTW